MHSVPRIRDALTIRTACLLCLLILFAGCAGITHLNGWQQQPVSAEFVDPHGFVRSPNDTSAYRSLQLGNGLEALLIQSEFPRAGVTLDVKVGSADNPPQFLGLAHFLEHMLFLGTEKYPEPQSYQSFIRINGGSYNATTGLDHTNYFFSIAADKLPQAMDRLAQFFIAPLFAPDYVDRELEIIEAEYRRTLDSEARALFLASAKLYNQQHPASRFSAGNRDTLLAHGRDALYAALEDFYHRYYRPERMRLVVVGNQSLDELESMARSTFGEIAASSLLPLPERPDLYRSEDLPALIEVASESERYSLDYTFPLPDQGKNVFTKPAAYVSHLLGHEAPGTLLSWLRGRNWAQSLSAGASSIGDAYNLHVNIRLTREGNHHIDAIHSAVFGYIDIVRKRAVQDAWRYQEVARMADTRFYWQEAGDPLSLARSLARTMHYVPTKEVFRATSLYSDFAPQQVAAILEALHPENVAIKRIAPDLETDRIDAYYNTRYKVSQLEQGYADRFLADVSGVRLPSVNPYIPDDLAVGKVVAAARPRRIEHPSLHAWLYQDSRFGVPRATINMSISAPQLVTNPAYRLLLAIYRSAKQREFEERFYTASLADLSFSLYAHLRGITLRTEGYDATIAPLFADMLAELARWELSPQEFERYKSELRIAIHNEQNNRAVNRLFRRLLANRMAHHWDYESRRQAVEELGYQDWLALRRILEKEATERTLLVHGEVSEESMERIVAQASGLFAAPLIMVEPPDVLPIAGPELVAEPVRDRQQSQVLALVHGNFAATLRNQLLTSLAANYLSGPFFHYMRTENKLGYQASVSNYDLLDHAALLLLVESNVSQPQELYAYYERFFASIRQRLPDDKTFHQLKHALAMGLAEPPLTLGDESSRIWHELFRRNYVFDTREQSMAALETLTARDLRRFILALFDPANRTNRLWIYSGEELQLLPGHIIAMRRSRQSL